MTNALDDFAAKRLELADRGTGDRIQVDEMGDEMRSHFHLDFAAKRCFLVLCQAANGAADEVGGGNGPRKLVLDSRDQVKSSAWAVAIWLSRAAEARRAVLRLIFVEP